MDDGILVEQDAGGEEAEIGAGFDQRRESLRTWWNGTEERGSVGEKKADLVA